LFTDAQDVDNAVKIIVDIMQNTLWDRPEYKTRAKVT
jgi:kynureninase